mgnify:CR=1 FL=1
MWTCSKCKITKDLKEFCTDKRRKNGKGVTCKKCVNLKEKIYRDKDSTKKRMLEYRIQNKEKLNKRKSDKHYESSKIIDGYKSFPCLDCNNIFLPVCMDFDHINKDKSNYVSCLKSGNIAKLIAEIKKCELVCANCHRIRTASRRPNKNKNKTIAKFRIFINKIKMSPCMDCNNCFPPEAMDFDHVMGEKLSCISNMICKNKNIVMEEIAKCELVCANCHRIRTIKRLKT